MAKLDCFNRMKKCAMINKIYEIPVSDENKATQVVAYCTDKLTNNNGGEIHAEDQKEDSKTF